MTKETNKMRKNTNLLLVRVGEPEGRQGGNRGIRVLPACVVGRVQGPRSGSHGDAGKSEINKRIGQQHEGTGHTGTERKRLKEHGKKMRKEEGKTKSKQRKRNNEVKPTTPDHLLLNRVPAALMLQALEVSAESMPYFRETKARKLTDILLFHVRYPETEKGQSQGRRFSTGKRAVKQSTRGKEKGE